MKASTYLTSAMILLLLWKASWTDANTVFSMFPQQEKVRPTLKNTVGAFTLTDFTLLTEPAIKVAIPFLGYALAGGEPSSDRGHIDCKGHRLTDKIEAYINHRGPAKQTIDTRKAARILHNISIMKNGSAIIHYLKEEMKKNQCTNPNLRLNAGLLLASLHISEKMGDITAATETPANMAIRNFLENAQHSLTATLEPLESFLNSQKYSLYSLGEIQFRPYQAIATEMELLEAVDISQNCLELGFQGMDWSKEAVRKFYPQYFYWKMHNAIRQYSPHRGEGDHPLLVKLARDNPPFISEYAKSNKADNLDNIEEVARDESGLDSDLSIGEFTCNYPTMKLKAPSDDAKAKQEKQPLPTGRTKYPFIFKKSLPSLKHKIPQNHFNSLVFKFTELEIDAVGFACALLSTNSIMKQDLDRVIMAEDQHKKMHKIYSVIHYQLQNYTQLANIVDALYTSDKFIAVQELFHPLLEQLKYTNDIH